MKKIFSVLITLMLLLSIFSTVALADENNNGKFTDQVQKTNQGIDNEIDKATEAANNLILKYQDDLVKSMNDLNVQDFDNYLNTVKDIVGLVNYSSDKADPAAKKLSHLDERLNDIEDKLNAREEQLQAMYDQLITLDANSKEYSDLSKQITVREQQLENKDQKAQERAEQLEDKFKQDMDKIIDNLVNTTNAMVRNLIAEGERQGVDIQSEWVEVQIGDRIILVDPCRTRST